MSVDSTDGTDRLTNIITYHYLIQHGVIKEGWQGREFIDDIEEKSIASLNKAEYHHLLLAGIVCSSIV